MCTGVTDSLEKDALNKTSLYDEWIDGFLASLHISKSLEPNTSMNDFWRKDCD